MLLTLVNTWFIVIVIFLPLTVLSHRVYYVQPSEGNYTSSCPVNSDCFKLSHYAAHMFIYFQSNTTFYFLPGRHILDKEIIVLAADNLTLKGLGERREGPTVNSMVSTTVISCSENIGGFRILLSKTITVSDITITNCTTTQGPALDFDKVENLSVKKTSLTNNGKAGMRIFNVVNLLIDECSFSMNGYDSEEITGNLAILTYFSTFNGTIQNTNFTSSNWPLDISIQSSLDVHLNIHKVLFAANKQHGNMWLAINNSTIGKIKLEEIVSTNGYAEKNAVGGLVVFLENINCSKNSEILLEKTRFEYNLLRSMSLQLRHVQQCRINIKKTQFFSNGVRNLVKNMTKISSEGNSTHGGGLEILTTGSSWGNKIVISNCIFQNNSAIYGGALMIRTHFCKNAIKITNTTFEGNYGYYGAAVVVNTQSANTNCKLTLDNVSVINNKRFSQTFMKAIFGKDFKYSSSIYMMNSAFVIYTSDKMSVEMTNIIVKDHYDMSGLSLHGCDVKFNGQMNAFINNSSPLLGAGLTLSTSNSIIVNEGSHVLFENNTAGLYGGAIYITEIDHEDVFLSVTVYGQFKRCSFMTNQTLTNSSKPLLTFKGNRAEKAGNDVYGGIYQFCTLSPDIKRHVELVHNPLDCPIAEYWSFENNEKNDSISSSPIAVCPCIDGKINCNVTSLHRSIYPGQSFSVSLVTVGACKGVSPSNLVTTMKNGTITTTAKNQVTERTCKEYEYVVNPEYLSSESLNGSSKVFINAARTNIAVGQELTINITYLPCPDGFQVSQVNGHYQCDCNSIICNSSIPTQCNIQDLHYGAFNRSGNNWIGYLPQYKCTVAYVDCPFDYCKSDHVSFNITSPDPQCNLNRSGILCGQCQSGLSLMLGSNQCGDCNSNINILLILVFAVAGILLLAILILFNMTVSSGDINGLLFYANLVKLNESIFFPQGTIPVLSQFIAWLNLDFGIQTCFFHGLDGYWKTWLQFVFPIYLWLLVGLVIIGCRYSITLSRFFGRNSVPVLATLFLMSFTKLFRNITNVFMYTTVTCGEDDFNFNEMLWRVDTKVKYLGAKHTVLLVFSTIFLIFSVIYTLLVFSSKWLQRFSGKVFYCETIRDPVVKLKPLIDAYCGPYKDTCRYWTGLLLMIRISLTIILSYTSNMSPTVNTTILLLVMLSLILTAWLVNGMYKDGELNYLEGFHYFSLCLITLGSIFVRQQIVTIVSVSLVLVVSIFVRIYKLFCLLKLKYRQCYRLNDSETAPILVNKNNVRNKSGTFPNESEGSPAVVVQRRDSIIFDFELSQ